MKTRLLFFSLLILSFATMGQTPTEPHFEWAHGFGDIGRECVLSITSDAIGNIYLTGYFEGTVDFDPSSGVFDLNSNGGEDIFIIKLNSGGNLIWAKSIGGTSGDAGRSIAIDSTGYIYITGSYRNTVDFDPSIGISNLSSNGGDDIFILKLDANGNFIWAKSIGSNTSDEGISIKLDNLNNVYITGLYSNTADFDPNIGMHNLTSVGNYDVFILKLDLDGDFVWANSIGGIDDDRGLSIAIDNEGNVIVSGLFENTIDFNPNAGIDLHSSNGSFDIFIVKLNSIGSFIWARSIGGIYNDYCRSLAIDDAGNILFTGIFESIVDFDAGIGISNLTSNGGRDIFVSKIDRFGNFVWANSFGSQEDYEMGESLYADSNGNLFITGYFKSTIDFNPGIDTYNLSSNGEFDVFVLNLDEYGTFKWAKSFGGTDDDYGMNIELDNFGNVYTVGGYKNSVDFNINNGGNIISSNGELDAFIIKLSQPISAYFSISDTIMFLGSNVQLTDSSSGNPISWLWDFGDGTTDTVQNPVHLYQNPGVYTVGLIVSNGFSTDTLIKPNYITVLAEPNWPFQTTNNFHTILVQPTTPVTIDGVQISSGDYIGVFYEDTSGNLQCGGYSEWTGSQFSVYAYGAEFLQSNGFTIGEEFKWKIWRASDYQEFDAEALYIQTMPHQQYFSGYGVSGLLSLSAVSQIFISDSLNQITCFGDSSGYIDISLSGGLPPYSYQWSNGEITEDIQSITAGIYFLTVSDSSGQTLVDSFEVIQPSSPIVISYTKSDVSVEGAKDGQIELNISGGNPPYSVLWSNYSTSLNLYGLSSGNYAVMVTDANLCDVSETIEITDSVSAQTIQLSAGWNMISTYINPYLSMMDSVFSLFTNLVILKDENGNTFWPAYGINMIGNWQIGEGYQLKVSVADSLVIYGSKIIPEQNPIAIQSGWSFIGYLRLFPLAVDSSLSTIEQNIYIVKNNDGAVYWPQYGFNLIGDMLPGQGYQINMNFADTLVYAPNFCTWACGDKILDFDGNQYNTVQIGSQCWMKENLNVGTMINGSVSQSNNGIIEKYCYNNDTANCSVYGSLYKWDEVMNYDTLESSQGICPTGWHIPSDEEWKVLEGEVDSQYNYPDLEWDNIAFRGFDVGFSLKSMILWASNGNDLFGFAASPGGFRNSTGYSNLGFSANFWTSTFYSSTYSWCRFVENYNDSVYRDYCFKANSYSIRCLKD